MNLIQKAINKISSMGSDSGSAAAYHGGGSSYSNGYRNGIGAGAKWAGGLNQSGQNLTINHHDMMLNARNAYQDSTQARAIIDRYADVVVDVGLLLLPTPDADVLGLSDEEVEIWSDRVKRRFDLFMRSKDFSVSGTFTGYQAQRMYEIFYQRDGDIFTRFYYSVTEGTASSLQVSFVDPTQLKSNAFTNTIGFNDGYFDGIKHDEYGKEISFSVWVKRSVDKPGYKLVEIPAVGESGRVHMTHGFNSEYAGQTRGYSPLGHCLQEFQAITDFTLATIQKSINQSNITMVVEPSDDEDAQDPFESITANNFGGGSASQQFGSNPVPAETAQNVGEIVDPVQYCPIPEANLNSPGSTGVFNLTKGSKLVPFQNSASSDTFDTFVDSFTSHLAASRSIPVEVLLMKFSSNYSASRGALLMFWRVAQIRRISIDSDFMEPIYQMWLSEEIASGRETAPGFSDPVLKQAWLCHSLQGTPVPNIDDKKAAQANEINLKMNATDFDRVAADTNQSNGKSNRNKLKRQVKEVVKMPWEKNKNA